MEILTGIPIKNTVAVIDGKTVPFKIAENELLTGIGVTYYVSTTGSNVAPYITLATAADCIETVMQYCALNGITTVNIEVQSGDYRSKPNTTTIVPDADIYIYSPSSDAEDFPLLSAIILDYTAGTLPTEKTILFEYLYLGSVYISSGYASTVGKLDITINACNAKPSTGSPYPYILSFSSVKIVSIEDVFLDGESSYSGIALQIPHYASVIRRTTIINTLNGIAFTSNPSADENPLILTIESIIIYNSIQHAFYLSKNVFDAQIDLYDSDIFFTTGDEIENSGGTYTKTNVIYVDPLFVDIDNGDYRLRIGSPCLNTGTGIENMGVYQGSGITPPVLIVGFQNTMPVLSKTANIGEIDTNETDNYFKFIIDDRIVGYIDGTGCHDGSPT